MHVFDTTALEMETVGQTDDTSARWRGAFPFSSDRPGETVGNSSEYTVVSNELEPGAEIGTHTDSVDELVLITRVRYSFTSVGPRERMQRTDGRQRASTAGRADRQASAPTRSRGTGDD